MPAPLRVPFRLLALAIVLVGTLSGCFTLRADLHLRTNDTVDGSIVLAFDERLAEQSGGDQALMNALLDSDAALFAESPSSGGIEVREYRDSQLIGVEYVLSAVPFSDFSAAAGSREGAVRELSITRVDDTFVVDGRVQIDALLGTASAPTTKALDRADLAISMTFPGEVHESNGTVKGSTVTWIPPVGDAFTLEAVGDAGDAKASGLLVGVLITVCLVAVLTALAVIASRRMSRDRSSNSSKG